MNKTYYFSRDEMIEALADYVLKKSNEYVHTPDFGFLCLDRNDMPLDVQICSIFNENFNG